MELKLPMTNAIGIAASILSVSTLIYFYGRKTIYALAPLPKAIWQSKKDLLETYAVLSVIPSIVLGIAGTKPFKVCWSAISADSGIPAGQKFLYFLLCSVIVSCSFFGLVCPFVIISSNWPKNRPKSSGRY